MGVDARLVTATLQAARNSVFTATGLVLLLHAFKVRDHWEFTPERRHGQTAWP